MLQSPVDIALIAGVVLLIFGPKKLPEMGKALGLGIGNFKRALFEAQDEVKSAIKDEPSHVQSTNLPQSTIASPVVAVGSEPKTDVSSVSERIAPLDEPRAVT